jgi:hypothetical protein
MTASKHFLTFSFLRLASHRLKQSAVLFLASFAQILLGSKACSTVWQQRWAATQLVSGPSKLHF